MMEIMKSIEKIGNEKASLDEIRDLVSEEWSLLDQEIEKQLSSDCLLYTSPSPRDRQKSRMPSSA